MRAVELAPIRIEEAKAGEYVSAHGGAREQARLAGILTAAAPPKAVVKELEGLQAQDGGFGAEALHGGTAGSEAGTGAPGLVAATCGVLAQLKDLPPLAGSPMASRAVAFLRRTQGTDGSWQEGTADPLVLTTMATYTLLTMEPEHNDPIARADGWLRRRLIDQPGALQAALLGTLPYAWAVWYRLRGPMAPETRAAFAALNARLEAGEGGAGEVARFLTCAWEVGAGGTFLLPVAQHLMRLAAMQQPDGSWPDSTGPVQTTLTALRLFRGFGLL